MRICHKLLQSCKSRNSFIFVLSSLHTNHVCNACTEATLNDDLASFKIKKKYVRIAAVSGFNWKGNFLPGHMS